MIAHDAGTQVDQSARSRKARVRALGFFGLSLLLLFVGNFIQFDDTSGFGSNDWLMPFDFLALVAAGFSLAAAMPDVSARRLLGGSLLLLDVLVAWQVMTNDGFRFIWSDDEGELFMLQVALAIAGLALMTKSIYRPAEPAGTSASTDPGREVRSGLELTGWARFVGYLTATVILVFVAFFRGVAHFEYTECSGPDFDGECDLAILGGFAWAAGAIVLAAIMVPVVEIALYVRRRHRSRAVES